MKYILFLLLVFSLHSDPVEEFYDALYQGDTDQVIYRIRAGFDINTPNPEGDTPLTSAISREMFHMARQLVEAGADISMADSEGRTPLMHAAQLGNRGIVLLLLEKGAALEMISKAEETALTIAIDSCHFELADLLIGKGADFKQGKTNNEYLDRIFKDKFDIVQSLKVLDWGDESYPLLLAASADDWNTMSQILETGTDPDESDADGLTSLMIAAAQKESFIPDLLVSAGADVNAQNRFGYSPLAYAAYAGNEKVVTLLLENGADLSPWNILEKSSLYWAVIQRDSLISEYLINAGAPLDAKGRDGQTILMTASLTANLAAIRFILDNLDNPDQRDLSGLNAFDYCLIAFKGAVKKNVYYETANLLAGAGLVPQRMTTNDSLMQGIINY